MRVVAGRTADISIMGFYGILNPMVWWLYQRRPELLASTPQELRKPRGGPPPKCCGAYMVYRREPEYGLPAWYCQLERRAWYGAEPQKGCGRYLIIAERRPAMESGQLDGFELNDELARAARGELREIAWTDDGRRVVYTAR